MCVCTCVRVCVCVPYLTEAGVDSVIKQDWLDSKFAPLLLQVYMHAMKTVSEPHLLKLTRLAVTLDTPAACYV